MTLDFLVVAGIIFGLGALIAWPIRRRNQRREAEERERGRMRAIEHANQMRRQADAERERLRDKGTP